MTRNIHFLLRESRKLSKEIRLFVAWSRHLLSFQLKQISVITTFLFYFQMTSAETPVLFAKACEMFILDLTMRAWY